MSPAFNQQRLAWIVLGVAVGFLLTALMPARPLHAVATHGQDGFALATGLIDNNVEGLYFLDHLTGDLNGAALNMNNGQFTTFFKSNVIKDMQLDVSKNPKFLMVTGLANVRRGPTQFQPGQAVIYVMELNSGAVAAYAVPWNSGRASLPSPAVQAAPFVLLDVKKFRDVAVRPQ